MDFEPTVEQIVFRDRVRRFAEAEVLPRAADLDAGREHPEGTLSRLGKERMMGVAVPEEDGGCGRDNVSYVLALVEVSKACASMGALMFVHNSLYCYPIVAYGTKEQRKKYLHRCSSGESLGVFALSERDAGSDPTRMRTRALRRGTGWLINGEKRHVTGGALSSFCTFPAVIGEGEDGEKSVGLFVVDLKETQGVRADRVEESLGLAAAGTAGMLFQDAGLPENARLDPPGKGLSYLSRLQAKAWVGVAAQALGVGRAVLEESLVHARSREHSGKPLLSLQAVQWKLADMAMELDAAELLVLRAAWLEDRTKPFRKEAATAKMFASDAAMKASLQGMQILGEYGCTKESPMERYLREAKIFQIYHGTNEMIRSVISGHLTRNTRGTM